jgi:hypothetical protein
MKSLAAWSTARLAVPEEAGRDAGAESEPELRQMMARLADALCSTIVEARALVLHRRQSEAVRRWAQQQNHALESAFERSLASVRERIVRGVSENLLPLLNRHIEQKSLEDFLAAVDAQTLDTIGEVVRISAPAPLAELVTDELKKRNLDVIVAGESQNEIVASIGETRIESRMGMASLKAEELLSNA